MRGRYSSQPAILVNINPTVEWSIHPPTMRSNCIDKTLLNEIGLKSFLMLRGGLILGW